MYTHCLHNVYTMFTHCLHNVYTMFTQCLHSVYTMFTHCLHNVYTMFTVFTHCLHTVYTMFTHCLHTVYTMFKQCLHNCLHTVYTMFTHCLHTVYTMFTHYLHTACCGVAVVLLLVLTSLDTPVKERRHHCWQFEYRRHGFPWGTVASGSPPVGRVKSSARVHLREESVRRAETDPVKTWRRPDSFCSFCWRSMFYIYFFFFFFFKMKCKQILALTHAHTFHAFTFF